jgi:hypothetical protein
VPHTAAAAADEDADATVSTEPDGAGMDDADDEAIRLSVGLREGSQRTASDPSCRVAFFNLSCMDLNLLLESCRSS